MSKIRAFTDKQWDDFIQERRYKDPESVGKDCIMCEFCGERIVQMTFAHDGYLGMTDVENHVYLFCGLCFFANIKYFLDYINGKI